MKRTIKTTLLMCLILIVSLFVLASCDGAITFLQEHVGYQPIPEESSTPMESTTTTHQPHVWSEWIIIKEAKCEEIGLLQRYCVDCYYTESKPMDKLGHTEVIDNQAVAPNCTEAGFTESKHCSVCNEVLAVQTVVDALGHSEVIDFAVSPTCTEAGLTEGKHCSVCGEVLVVRVVTEAKGHNFGEWVTVKEPSETEEGLMTRSCACGEEETQTIKNVYMSIGLEYTLNNDGVSYSVTGIGSCTDTDITIPTTYSGIPVTSIGNYAFDGCTELTSITIPDSVIGVGLWAFNGCTGLTSITVDSGNTNYHAVGNCLIETGSKKLLFGCQNSVIPTDGSVTSIGSYAFEGCTGLTNIIIPDGVKSIGASAFNGCTGLTNITIPNGVESIGVSAFNGCTGLTSIVIPNSVASISDYAFSGCTGLTSIIIPNSVTIIGNYTFNGCSSLTSVKIPNSVIRIKGYAFYGCSSLTSVMIPYSVISIGNYAFCSCFNLTSFVFDNTSTWYRTNNYNEWYYMTNGISTTVTNASTNATYFKSTYCDYYWYKL